jgi:hypothetical protein
MTRDELIEKMAEAIEKEGAEGCPCPESYAAAALAAIEVAGYTVTLLDKLQNNCSKPLDENGYCATCGWDAKTRSYRLASPLSPGGEK